MRTIACPLILITVLLIGCSFPVVQNEEDLLAPVPASHTPLLTDILIRPSPTPVPDITLNACGLAINESEQIDFRGVYPGVTTVSEMLEILGKPDITDPFDVVRIVYIYYPQDETSKTTQTNINTKNEQVTSIIEIFTNENYDPYYNPYYVKDVISEHGCPDLLFLIPWGEEVPGYRGAYLVYTQKGIDFIVEGLPLTDTVPVRYQSYFQPTTIDLFLEMRDDYISSPTRPTTWVEASTWQYGQPE